MCFCERATTKLEQNRRKFFSLLIQGYALVSFRVEGVGKKVPELKVNFLKAVFLSFWCRMYVVLV